MGSGGLIVMDETSCMVDVAKFFMEFCRDESCGKCVPCRAGTVQMYGLLDKITRGEATRRDLELLEQLCGPGQEHEPVRPRADGAEPRGLSTLRYFRDEYLAHIDERRCPAGVCTIAPAAARGGAPVSVKTFTLDGKLVSAGEDQTILDVCDEQTGRPSRACATWTGSAIIGACRLCLVEIQGWTKLAPCLHDAGRGGHGRHAPAPTGCRATGG